VQAFLDILGKKADKPPHVISVRAKLMHVPVAETCQSCVQQEYRFLAVPVAFPCPDLGIMCGIFTCRQDAF